MKKWLIPVIVLVVFGFGLYTWAKNFNNTAVTLKETATKTWGDVESSYQRRNDLIGNLVKPYKVQPILKKAPLKQSLKHDLRPQKQPLTLLISLLKIW